MRYQDPIYLFLLIPAILFVIAFMLGWIGKEPALKFSSLQLVKSAGGKKISFRRLYPALLRLAVLVLLVLALIRPQTGTGEEKSTRHVVDIMLALDVSGSMATLDFNPGNRLTAAKLEAKRFVEGRKNDRIGLVVFAGESFTQCPLTVDHTAVTTLLERVDMGMVKDGTAIGLGLGNAVNRLKNSEAKTKIVVLLTDGVNNAGEIDPRTASDLAVQQKVRVYTIGMGKQGKSYLPINDPRFGSRRIQVETEIDEKMMNDISSKTGGKYFRAQDEKALRDIFREIDRLEKTEVTVEKFMHYDEKYFMFLWPALWILLFEILWTNFLFVKVP